MPQSSARKAAAVVSTWCAGSTPGCGGAYAGRRRGGGGLRSGQVERLRPGDPPEKARRDEYYEVLDKTKRDREVREKARQRKKVLPRSAPAAPAVGTASDPDAHQLTILLGAVLPLEPGVRPPAGRDWC